MSFFYINNLIHLAPQNPSLSTHDELLTGKVARQGRGRRLTLTRLLGPVRLPDARGGLVDGGEAWTFGQLLEALGASLQGVRPEDGGVHG